MDVLEFYTEQTKREQDEYGASNLRGVVEEPNEDRWLGLMPESQAPSGKSSPMRSDSYTAHRPAPKPGKMNGYEPNGRSVEQDINEMMDDLAVKSVSESLKFVTICNLTTLTSFNRAVLLPHTDHLRRDPQNRSIYLESQDILAHRALLTLLLAIQSLQEMSAHQHDNLHKLNTHVKENANHPVVQDNNVCRSEAAVFLLLVSSNHMSALPLTEKRKDVNERRRESIVKEKRNSLNRSITLHQLLPQLKRKSRSSVSVLWPSHRLWRSFVRLNWPFTFFQLIWALFNLIGL